VRTCPVHQYARDEGQISPDITIILDGYTRGDTLNKYLNYDNSLFPDKLTQMGFYVAYQPEQLLVHSVIACIFLEPELPGSICPGYFDFEKEDHRSSATWYCTMKSSGH
jgi:hypothetical protein